MDRVKNVMSLECLAKISHTRAGTPISKQDLTRFIFSGKSYVMFKIIVIVK